MPGGEVARGPGPPLKWRTSLNLELGTVVECDDTGCRVQLIDSGDTVTAAFSEKVKNNIRIRQQQLVAIDASANPPQIAWRWFIGEVESVKGDTASIRRLDQPPGSCELIANATGVPVAPGDIVFYGHGDHSEVVSRVVDGQPADASRVVERHLPGVVDTLRRLDEN